MSGLRMLCPALDYLNVQLAQHHRRIAKVFGKEHFRPKSLEAAKQAIKTRLTIQADRPRSLEELQKFIDTRANDLLLTPPRPIKLIREAPIELAALF